VLMTMMITMMVIVTIIMTVNLLIEIVRMQTKRQVKNIMIMLKMILITLFKIPFITNIIAPCRLET